MSNELAKLFVTIGLDDSDLQTSLKGLQKNLTDAGKLMTSIGVPITAAMTGAIYSFTSTGTALSELSDKTGMSVETLSQLSFAAQMTGADLSNIEVSAKAMAKAIADVSGGSSTAQKAIADLGLNLKDLQAMSPDQQFIAITTALANVEDPTKKAALALAIFGKSGTDLLPMLAGGADGLKSLMDQAVKTGDVMDQSGADSSVKMSQALETLKASVAGVGVTIGATLAPILTELLGKITPIIEGITDWTKAHPELAKVILVVVAAVGALFAVLGPILMMLPLLAAGFTIMLGPVGLVVAAIAAFAALAAVVMLNWDSITSFFSNLWADVVNGFKSAVNFLIGFAEGWANSYINVVNFIIGALDKIQFTLPDWIPGIGGKTFGINIPTVPLVSIPRLDTGGMVMQTGMAIVDKGEQFSGVGNTFGGGYKSANIYFQIDGRTLAKIVGQPLVDEIRLQTGMQIQMARPVSVFIGGNLVVVKTDSFTADSRLEQRSTAAFIVEDTGGIASYSQNQAVAVYSGAISSPSGTPVFGGFINSVKADPIGATNGLLHQVSCKDNTYLADKRLVVKSYTSQTLAYIVNDIITTYLAAEGITAGTIQTGPVVASAIFNYMNATACFDALKDLSGFTWHVNHDKSLDFIDRATNAAPWALTEINVLFGSAARDGGNASYRNRQYIRGGTGTTVQQTENRTGDGTTKAFTVGYPLASAPTITVGGVGKTVGIKGVDSGKDSYWAKGDATITFASAPAGAAAIVIVYYGQYKIISQAQDYIAINAQQALDGGTGIIESIATETQHESSTSSTASAAGKLQQYCQDAEKFTFRTYSSGLLAGQMLPVTYAPFGYSSSPMLLESVSIQEQSNQLFYAISAITGPVLGSWTKLFSNILVRQDNSIKIGDSLLLILFQQPENMVLAESTAMHTDDFSGGIVNHWLALPPAQGKGCNVEHEKLVLAETPAITSHSKTTYLWDDAAAKWGFSTWG